MRNKARLTASISILASLLWAGDALTAQRGASDRAAAPAPLYLRLGCSNCHGEAGQGSIAGPRLAPNPLSFETFTRAVRTPRAEMPAYSERVITDAQLREIHEHLAGIHSVIRKRAPRPGSGVPGGNR